jgi:hypothetical protein
MVNKIFCLTKLQVRNFETKSSPNPELIWVIVGDIFKEKMRPNGEISPNLATLVHTYAKLTSFRF